jgi:phenylalanyl-tRNA synthetase beta chain
MKIVHSWLLDLAKSLPDDVDAIAETLSDIGLACESVDRVGATVAGVITARVIKTERHPDAAKVHRVFLDCGDGTEHHVWCGAFNMQPGDIIRRSGHRNQAHRGHPQRGYVLFGARVGPR